MITGFVLGNVYSFLSGYLTCELGC